MLIRLKFDGSRIDLAFGTTKIHLKRVDSLFDGGASKSGSTRGVFKWNVNRFKFKQSQEINEDWNSWIQTLCHEFKSRSHYKKIKIYVKSWVLFCFCVRFAWGFVISYWKKTFKIDISIVVKILYLKLKCQTHLLFLTLNVLKPIIAILQSTLLPTPSFMSNS